MSLLEQNVFTASKCVWTVAIITQHNTHVPNKNQRIKFAWSCIVYINYSISSSSWLQCVPVVKQDRHKEREKRENHIFWQLGLALAVIRRGGSGRE